MDANIRIEIKNADNPGECYMLYNTPMTFFKAPCGRRHGTEISHLERYKESLGEVIVYEADKEIAEFDTFDEFWRHISS